LVVRLVIMVSVTLKQFWLSGQWAVVPPPPVVLQIMGDGFSWTVTQS